MQMRRRQEQPPPPQCKDGGANDSGSGSDYSGGSDLDLTEDSESDYEVDTHICNTQQRTKDRLVPHKEIIEALTTLRQKVRDISSEMSTILTEIDSLEGKLTQPYNREI
jgi:hypothetical protein